MASWEGRNKNRWDNTFSSLPSVDHVIMGGNRYIVILNGVKNLMFQLNRPEKFFGTASE